MILVTGGAGFIGSCFVQDWLAHEAEPLVVFDALTYAGSLYTLAALQQHPDFHFVHGDLCDQPRLQHTLGHYRPRAVVHLAAETHVDRSIAGPARFVQTNVVGTQVLLDAVRQYWQTLSPGRQQAFRFLQVSTDEVYGALSDQDPPWTEQQPYRPSSPYAASKAAADHLASAWQHTYGLPVLISHCTNNYGPAQYPEKLIPRLIDCALRDQPLPVYGSGLQKRDWLHVSDHVRALRLLLAGGQVGEHYHIGGQQEHTNLQVVVQLCAVLDRLAPRLDGQSHAAQITHVTDRPGHDWRYALNPEKIHRQLGWQPRIRWEQGLEDTVRWYLQHQDWVAHMQQRQK